MKIPKAAEASGLPTYTIRSCEKSGMLPEIARGADGHRRFSPRDIEWQSLLYRLRETGMPLAKMRSFISLAKEGSKGFDERRQILLDHGKILKERRTVLEKCEAALAIKLESQRPARRQASA